MLKQWYRDNRLIVLLAMLATITSAIVCSLTYLANNVFLEAEEVPEVATVLVVTVEPTEASTATVEPTLVPDIEDTFTAIVDSVNCELEEPCAVPLWGTYERIVLTGTVPVGGVVDVISCYYPVVEIQGVSEDGILPINTFSSYTLEGLWCEMYYVESEGIVVKGFMRYWDLRVLVSEDLGE